ncbi:glycosyltransferase family 4 protein [Gelidibacter salicanalis]|uniref:Glycosyltransferase family 4 protein n=1 Tax=Gelidibacter salicanalis TaxID=291193 RepID=A0A934KTG3_9FLAO|nr:glycosyltransferase family 4 protein [Gelidibacter salicanalis]MBJ7879160.1 glycosyltransferase family 4 protein [Gelidibacter salicanalis]
MKQQAILFVLESFLPDHRAGTEIYVLNLCRYFKNKGWRVGVLIATINQQKDYSYEGIPVYTFPIPEKPNSRELNGLMPPRGIEDFIDRVEELKPDVVHFHSFGRAINGLHLKRTKELGYITAFTPHLANLFCIKGNMRLFEQTNCDGRVIPSRCMSCLLHSKGYNYTVSKALGSGLSVAIKMKFLQKAMVPSWHQAKHRSEELQRISTYADVIFAIAPWVQNAFRANGITDSILIPQGISPVFFEDLNHQQSLNPSGINFIFIGRMHPVKGFHFLKQAWENLKTKTHKLHIITNPSRDENDYFKTYKTWADQDSSIIWNEGFSQSQVASYLDAMDVLILPSISEVAPLVMLEAATRRIPVIASDFVAMKDMIDPNVNGLLFKNGDWQDLLLQLNKISDKPELISKLGENIQMPATMTHVAALIEHEILKRVST